jgi:hypothetical protein
MDKTLLADDVTLKRGVPASHSVEVYEKMEP